ncbi:MAG: GNAT family N-acetyltransferase [Sedimentisphaerales bacterium]|nr:GNAT family N-acetyltransferase [Sedimentisphaerales bacterium]
MPTDVTIRTAIPADADAIAAFNIAMAKETENKDLESAVIREGVNNLFSNSRYGFYVAAETNHTVIGCLLITYEWSDWRNGVFWWVQSLYVLPQYRRHGVFRKMYTWIREQAQNSTGVCGLRLYVEKDNTTAQKAYQTLGLERTTYGVFEELF